MEPTDTEQETDNALADRVKRIADRLAKDFDISMVTNPDKLEMLGHAVDLVINSK